MKALLVPLAACAALSGCAVYDPYGYAYPGYSYPTTVYSGGAYPSYPGTTYGATVYGAYPTYPAYPTQVDPYGRTHRDRDRDGVPNRFDHDRDGDGVPNAYDAYPMDPRRR